jgi:hypothetical protein
MSQTLVCVVVVVTSIHKARVARCRFISGSFDEDVAYEFLHRRAVDVGLPPVLFIIHLDPRGETQFRFRCKHVNYIANSHVPREQEFLFIPYSVFTVGEAEWKVNHCFLLFLPWILIDYK